METILGIMALVGVGCILIGLRPGPWEIDHLEIEVVPPRPRPRRTERIQAVTRELTSFYASRTDRISLTDMGHDATGLATPAPPSQEAGAV